MAVVSKQRQEDSERQAQQPDRQGRAMEPGAQARQRAASSEQPSAWELKEEVMQRAREGAALTAVSVGLLCMLIKGLEDD